MEVEYLLGGPSKRMQIHLKESPDLLKVMIFNSFCSIRRYKQKDEGRRGCQGVISLAKRISKYRNLNNPDFQEEWEYNKLLDCLALGMSISEVVRGKNSS